MTDARYQGHVGAHLVLGGVDSTGPHLFTIHAHGSTDKLPYVTMGSGSLAAMAVFESAYKEHMTVSLLTIQPGLLLRCHSLCFMLTRSAKKRSTSSHGRSDQVSSTIWVPEAMWMSR